MSALRRSVERFAQKRSASNIENVLSGKDINEVITRKLFEDLTKEHFAKLIPLVRKSIKNAKGIDKDSITDVILVGEIRDKETAVAAVQAAMTGHQVYSSLHTNDAFSAIPRLMQIGVEPYLLSGSLICIMAQRLTRKLCPHCKIPYKPTEHERKVINYFLGEEKGNQVEFIYKENGCDKCRHNGTIGRMCIVEIIDIDKEIDEMIVSKATKKENYTGDYF